MIFLQRECVPIDQPIVFWHHARGFYHGARQSAFDIRISMAEASSLDLKVIEGDTKI